MFYKISTTVFIIAALLFNVTIAHAVPIALSPTTIIDVSSGSGVSSGTVSTGHTVFQFDAFAGNLITIAVNVTATFPGSAPFFTNDDDTHLFLYNDLGLLLAEDDDSGPGFSSLISGFSLLTTGTYYAGVATFPTVPTPFPFPGIITGWTDNGQSSVAFNLNISGVVAPPPPVLPPIAVPEPSTLVLVGSWIVAGLGTTIIKRRYTV